MTGAGGFIGHHLASCFRKQGHWVRGVDLKHPDYAPSDADDFQVRDLRDPEHAREATRGVDDVYALAADMGGMGYISSNHATIQHNNALINLNTLEAARQNGVARYLYTSSACVYPEYKQTAAAVTALKEEDAYPAQPQDAYGWEKLITERLCMHYREDHGLATRIVRLHNIFGPLGTWDGGREKAPAAMCRKVAIAKLTGQSEIEIWGDGEQTRSFCYIDDLVDGIYRLLMSSHHGPVNLGNPRELSLLEMAQKVIRLTGSRSRIVHRPLPVDDPKVRQPDITLARKHLGWGPRVGLDEGLRRTVRYFQERLRPSKRRGSPARSGRS